MVEATRKPEDLEPWIDGLPQVDAIVVQDSDLSADPAAVLRRVDARGPDRRRPGDAAPLGLAAL